MDDLVVRILRTYIYSSRVSCVLLIIYSYTKNSFITIQTSTLTPPLKQLGRSNTEKKIQKRVSSHYTVHHVHFIRLDVWGELIGDKKKTWLVNTIVQRIVVQLKLQATTLKTMLRRRMLIWKLVHWTEYDYVVVMGHC